jgi:hypothetical protein
MPHPNSGLVLMRGGFVGRQSISGQPGRSEEDPQGRPGAPEKRVEHIELLRPEVCTLDQPHELGRVGRD